MKIDINTLKKIAHLARLEFDEKSAEKMTRDMTPRLGGTPQSSGYRRDRTDYHHVLRSQCAARR